MKEKISVVTSVYLSENYINDFHKKLLYSLKKINITNYEVIYVNDGSPGNDLQVLKKLLYTDPNIKIVNLSRNFGHHPALISGLREAKGDYIFLIDSDLEENPEWLVYFFKSLKKSDSEIVIGQQIKRKGNLFEKIFGSLFYHLMINVFDTKIIQNHTTACLMSKKFHHSMLKHTETVFTLTSLFYLTGYKQLIIPVEKKSKGISSYTFNKKISLLLKNIVVLTDKPLIIIFFMGIMISFIALFFGIYILYQKFNNAIGIDGFTTLAIMILFFSGLIIFNQGLIAAYIQKVLLETKQRPLTIISEIITKNEK